MGIKMKHTAIIIKKPVRTGKQSIPDGAITGNGDLSVILGNSPEGMRIYIAKCDQWRLEEASDGNGGIKPVGYIDLAVPRELYNNYHVEQRMDEAEIFCRFESGDDFFELRIIVCATRNTVVFNLGGTHQIPEPQLTGFRCKAEEFEEKQLGNISVFSRMFNNDNINFPIGVAAALKKTAENQYVLHVMSSVENEQYKIACLDELEELDAQRVAVLIQDHAEWWKNFYSKSSFSLSDKELEMNWYASQYFLAVCARNTEFPPGLFGNFITTEKPDWHGDYHLNYNYQAPFYAACNSNHVELTDCYVAPLRDFVPKGMKYARKYLGCGGIYFPVAILPKGNCSELPSSPLNFERLFLGQKSNAVHAADILIFRWYATRDTDYAAEHIYPYLLLLADFWEDYLKYKNGRYIIYNDAVHEVPYYRTDFDPSKHKREINAVNNLLSLGMVRLLFGALVDISSALNVDDNRRDDWMHILTRMSNFPTFFKKFKRVFRYTEKGMAWNKTNSLNIQHIYPAGQIGMGGDPKMLKVARNTFFADDRWFDDNATNSVFPCAARLGIEPSKIIDKLKQNYKKFQLPNLLMLHKGGCLENCSLSAATLNEMAMQSYEGIIRFFPDWEPSIDCTFKNLRADGAFLVSAQMKRGEIGNIHIFCEKGGKLVFLNPYHEAKITVLFGENVKTPDTNGSLCENPFVSGDRVVVIETSPGEIVNVDEA